MSDTNAMWDDPYSNSKAVAVFDRTDTFVGLRGKQGEVIDLADVLDNAKPMADYAALRAYTGRATGVRITQAGLAGFFQRDDADTNSADNGGTIIVDASGRRWKRLVFGPVNVQWFGAKGDYNGSTGTDNTLAIQAAIDYSVANKVALHFPAGRYLVTAALKLPDGTSDPYLSVVFVGDGSVANTMNGVFTGTQIFTTAGSMFRTKTTPQGSGAMPSVAFKASGIQFSTNYTSNPSGICFDTVRLYGALVDGCGFYGFDVLLYGAMTNKSLFTKSRMGVRRFLKRNTSYSDVSADSDIELNNINGLSSTPAGMTKDPLIDLTNAAQINVHGNYIDFTYLGVKTGGSGQNISVTGNVFDVCFRAVSTTYGFGSKLIASNKFLNIKKSSVGLVNTPYSEMSTDNWACVLIDGERCANLNVADNLYNDSDRFVLFGSGAKGNWNIKESGNIGIYNVSGSPAPADVVDFGSRNIDTVNYPLDNKNIELQSLEGKVSNSIRGKRTAYIGLNYLLGSPPVRLRVNEDYSLSDTLGSYLWGKTNLLAASDFASGWTFGSGVSQVGGVFTATSGAGWSYIPFVGGAGTYVVCLNITSASGNSILAGYSLTDTPTSYADNGISNLGVTVGSVVNTPGRAFFQLNVPSTTARIGIFLGNPTNCTIDYIHVIKIA